MYKLNDTLQDIGLWETGTCMFLEKLYTYITHNLSKLSHANAHSLPGPVVVPFQPVVMALPLSVAHRHRSM